MKAFVFGLAGAALLSGCAIGIQPGQSPSVSYTVARDYQTVYRRAEDQADHCLRGKNAYTVQATLNRDARSGVVAVVAPLGAGIVARTELKAIDAKHTHVSQIVWGHTPWDRAALDAMRESVRLDTTVCFAYK
ncbi:MAG: hypothetical protein EPN46_10135 [Candidimonas sp.]|nr:MAG: hypothetical protein EPN77_00665 [Candidimonas sp.]TAM21028.1 MAG: hypothetical protein EPN62_15215 [Candidimonas sp.]TAM75593.1 MAG: hypothetical protein EPN46_10135 [Candidimonas sp.]